MRSARLRSRKSAESQLVRHAENLAFIWAMRASTTQARYADLGILSQVDERIDFHLAALRAAGDAGWKACGASDAWKGAESFAAALVAFATDDHARIAAVSDAVVAAPDLTGPVAAALGWLEYGDVRQHVRALLQADAPAVRRLGLAACCAQREDPGQALDDALHDPDAGLRAQALRAVGELGFAALQPLVEPHIQDEDDECRYAAAWSLTMLGSAKAVPVLGSFAVGGGARAEESCAVALRRLPLRDALAAHKEILHRADNPRLAVVAAGIIGVPSFVPWLIEQMESPKLARAAGESFSRITGADLAWDDLDGAPPVRMFRGGHEPADEPPQDSDPDDGYLWPSADRVASWWNARRRDFVSGNRYLLGQEMTREWLKTVLWNGRQPQRACAAFELALAFPGRPLFDVRAPAVRQEALLRHENLERRVRRLNLSEVS